MLRKRCKAIVDKIQSMSADEQALPPEIETPIVPPPPTP
jgi:hypothetical protein